MGSPPLVAAAQRGGVLESCRREMLKNGENCHLISADLLRIYSPKFRLPVCTEASLLCVHLYVCLY